MAPKAELADYVNFRDPACDPCKETAMVCRTISDGQACFHCTNKRKSCTGKCTMMSWYAIDY